MVAVVVLRDIFPSRNSPPPSLHVACIAKLAFTSVATAARLVKLPTRKIESERERKDFRESLGVVKESWCVEGVLVVVVLVVGKNS